MPSKPGAVDLPFSQLSSSCTWSIPWWHPVGYAHYRFFLAPHLPLGSGLGQPSTQPPQGLQCCSEEQSLAIHLKGLPEASSSEKEQRRGKALLQTGSPAGIGRVCQKRPCPGIFEGSPLRTHLGEGSLARKRPGRGRGPEGIWEGPEWLLWTVQEGRHSWLSLWFP